MVYELGRGNPLKEKTMRCAECGSERIRLSNEPITEEFRGDTFTVAGIEHYVCEDCGEVTMSTTEATRLGEALASRYRKAHELLAPAQIRALRESLALTQKEFEKVLGVSSLTVCRWERGTIVQTKVADNLMRAIASSATVRNELMLRANVRLSA